MWERAPRPRCTVPCDIWARRRHPPPSDSRRRNAWGSLRNARVSATCSRSSKRAGAILQLPPLGGEPMLEAEEILGAEEETPMGALRPVELEPCGQQSLCRERAVAADLGGPDRGKVGGRGQPLEQRGFPRPVLAHEERHAGGEVEWRQRPDGGDGEREILLTGGRRSLQAHSQQLCLPGHRYPAARRLNSSAYRPPRATSSSCVPWSMSSPPCSTRIRSAMRTVEKRCEMSTAIRPFVSSANRKNTSYSARASSDAVGSSRISTWASRM